MRLKVRDLWASTWPAILADPESRANSTTRRGPDQRLLRSLVWDRWAFNLTLQFNAFRCLNFSSPGWSSAPWPTPREPLVPNNFVGANVSKNRTMWVECPVECRPKEHEEWIYC